MKLNEVYAFRYLATHLFYARKEERLYQLLTSKKWLTQMRQFDISGRLYAQDVDLTLDLVNEPFSDLLSSHESINSTGVFDQSVERLPRLIGLTLAKSVIHGMGKNIPIEAIAGLAQLGKVDIAMDFAALISDGGDLTGTKLFAEEIMRDFGNVLRISKQAEAYRRIARVLLLNQTEDGRNQINQRIDPENDRIARTALANARRILESYDKDLADVVLVPEFTDTKFVSNSENQNMLSDLTVGRNKVITVSTEKKSAEVAISEELINSTGGIVWHAGFLKQLSDEAGDKRKILKDLSDGIEDAIINNPEEVEPLLRKSIEMVESFDSGGWFGGDITAELSFLANQFAKAGNRSLALELISVFKELNYEYEDQKARSLAGAVGALSPILTEEETRNQLEEALGIANKCGREDFRVLGMSKVAAAMHKAGFTMKAKKVLRKTIKIAKDIFPLYDRDFALEALSQAATLNQDFDTLLQILSLAESIQDEEQPMDHKNWRIVYSFAIAGMFKYAMKLINEFWPRKGDSDDGWRKSAIQSLISEMNDTSFIEEALDTISSFTNRIDQIQAISMLALQALKHYGKSYADGLLKQSVDNKIIPALKIEGEETIYSMFKYILNAAVKVESLESISELKQLRTWLKKNRDEVTIDLIGAYLDLSGDINIPYQLSSEIEAAGLRAIALAKISKVLSTNNASVDEVLKKAIHFALEEIDLDIRVAACRDVAYELVKYGQPSGLDLLLNGAFDIINGPHNESYPSFMWDEIGSTTPELLPDNQTSDALSFIHLLRFTNNQEVLEKAIETIDSEDELLKRSYLISEMVNALQGKKSFELANRRINELQRQLRSAVTRKREYYRKNNYIWKPLDDVNYVVEVAESMALIHDSKGLMKLFAKCQYMSHPEWFPRWSESNLSWAQTRAIGSVLGHMLELNMQGEITQILNKVNSDEERAYVVFHMVRILMPQDQSTNIDIPLRIAHQIKDKSNYEFAMRRLTWLLARYDQKDKAWQTAREAFEAAINSISRLRDNSLFNCLSETTNGLLPMAKKDRIGTLLFIQFAMNSVQNLGEPDVWSMISAIFPLVAIISSSKITENIWLELQRIKNIR